MSQLLSAKVTIFEGPDGSGKSTVAAKFAASTGARLVHLGPFPRVGKSLGRLYVEAMLPAILGYQDVVLDRSWLSEPVYGTVFREGQDRLGPIGQRLLERLALRCGAVVVWCQPPLESIQENYRQRNQKEVLNGREVRMDKLEQLIRLYRQQTTDLPNLIFDYTKKEDDRLLEFRVEDQRTLLHPLKLASAGNWQAKLIIVGQDFAFQKDQDPMYQWPFASFSKEGCSQWLTQQLEIAEKSEHDVLWVNADQDLSGLPWSGKKILTLGEHATSTIATTYGKTPIPIPHPQAWKRFHDGERYPLLNYL